MRLAILSAFSIAAMGSALIVAAIAPAAAQERGGRLERLMEADANKDGAITRAEMRAAREAAFRRMDANNDGYISEDERRQASEAAAARRKDKGARGADANNDGKISREEFLAMPMHGFDRLDANNNGVIEAAEIDRARAMMERRKQANTP